MIRRISDELLLVLVRLTFVRTGFDPVIVDTPDVSNVSELAAA